MCYVTDIFESFVCLLCQIQRLISLHKFQYLLFNCYVVQTIYLLIENPIFHLQRRPISIQERIPVTTTQATTTTTTTTTTAASVEFEEEEDTAVNRMSRLTLPSNATSIRSDITDTFSCAGRRYGYYADVENDCQIFHVCLPVTYPDGQERQFRWSFICPEETTFNQVGIL